MVCGLACSCRASRSVKKPCSSDVTVGAVMTSAPWWASLPCVEAVRGVGEQFGHCVQIPVGGGGIDMTEPGRQQWQARLNVLAVAVPVDHRGHGEGVPQIMEPGWPAAGRGGQIGSGDDLPEGDAQLCPGRAPRGGC